MTVITSITAYLRIFSLLTFYNPLDLINNVFFNTLEYYSTNRNLLYEILDHPIQFLILEGFVKERAIPECNIYKRDLRDFCKREFEELTAQIETISAI